MLISKNRASFHLWRKENLLKHHKVSKYYKSGCLEKFILIFLPLLTARTDETVIFRLEFNLSF